MPGDVLKKTGDDSIEVRSFQYPIALIPPLSVGEVQTEVDQ
jgi:hypothetical protein